MKQKPDIARQDIVQIIEKALNAKWIGLRPELILPGRPYLNGRHERFHLTLKRRTAFPPRSNLATQQLAFDEFVMGQPRVERVAGTPQEGFVTYVQRTPQLQVPDYISVRFFDLSFE